MSDLHAAMDRRTQRGCASIIGAGLAGLIAAVHAVKAGARCA